MTRALFSLLMLSLGTLNAMGSIPKSEFLIDKLVAHSGTGIYAIEQDVIFASAQESVTFREIWQMDGENHLRLTVRPPKELQDSVSIQSLYLNGTKSLLSGRSRQSGRINEDFIEKFFYFRSREALHTLLTQMGILSPHVAATPTPKPVKKAKADKAKKSKSGEEKEKDEKPEFVYLPEPNVRLARWGGVVAYAFGNPTPVDAEPAPGFWIEQDQFFLRKFRLPSHVEVTADNYGSFTRGLHLPQQRTVRWNQHVVQINLVRVTGLPASAKSVFSATSVDVPTKISGLRDPDIAQQVEEFYSRFR